MLETATAVVTIIGTLLALLISLAKLNHKERKTVWDWTKRIILLAFYLMVIAACTLGFYVFMSREGDIARREVVMLFGYFFNLMIYSVFLISDLGDWYRHATENNEKPESPIQPVAE